ncbi:MAG: CotH kinase family protein [Aureibaculum sp.]|nr:CotH kinase family protein [Aureibaculum sp.]
MILLGGNLHKEGIFGEVLKPLIQENIKIPVNYIKGILSEPEHLIIDIKHKDYQKLAYKRKVAVQEGVLHPYKEDFVPAKIRWNGEAIKIKMRLKGDLGDHWSRDHKWSFRIKVKQDNSIMGMSAFSLQHPRTRGFLNDWYLHKILQHFGFITLRYDFVEVTVNGRHLGIYAIEEHFDKRLIENNRHINGPIIRIKDHLLWYLVDPKTGFERKDLDELYSSSPIDAFNTNTINQDGVLSENFKKAKNLLEAFRRGKLLTHQVFDIDKISKIFAVIDLLGYRHSTAYSNIRFYYNPITSLLVPIGYDNTFIEEADSIEGQAKRIKVNVSETPQRLDWRKTFFEDEVFFRKYIEALTEISEKNFLDELFNNVQDEYKEKLAIIYSSFPGYDFSKQKVKLYKNQVFIKSILNPLEGIQAYFKSIDRNKGILTLQIGNIQLLPVELIDAYYGAYRMKLLKNNVLLQSKTPFQPIEFQEVQFELPKGALLPKDLENNLRVNYKIFGTNDNKEITVFNWSYYDKDFLKADFIRQKPNYRSFDFMHADDDTKTIFIKPGVWDINKSIIISDGFTVVCREGTQLNLMNSATILSYSPLDFVGSDESQIIIKSSDSTGQGIAVISANKKSILKNVTFHNLSSPSKSGWELPGAVTFYESDVNIEKTSFIGNKSGVGLSIIRSDFNISRSNFNNTFSDALSVFFGNGEISKTSFADSKRDGLHFLGSVINIEDIHINKVQDAGINAGDRSRVTGNKIEIYGAKIAVKSKDSSDINMENAKIVDSDLAFFAMQEKQEFGPARISVNNLSINNVTNENIIQDKSTLLINGINMK